jgi:uncharacterized cupin superfamily protein
MAWTDNELSTLESLTRHEAEINNLVSRYTRKAVTVATTTQLTAVPDTITAIVAVKSDGTSASLTKATTWPLTAGTYVRLITTPSDYFSLLEGTGSIVTSGGGTYSLSFGTAPTWTDVELQADWQDKIDLAKQIIYDAIFVNLTSKASVEDISTIIDAIGNPTALGIASDYKTLELIYMDLYGKIGTAETIQMKLDYYRNQFEDAFARAYSALDFGDYGYLFTTSMGRISR